MRTRVRHLLIASLLLWSLAIAVVPAETSAHTYTTSYLYCWKFTSGVYYLREHFTRYQDNPWGGHSAAYTWEVQYGRCYPA